MAAVIDRDAWLTALGETAVVDDREALTVLEFGALLGLGRNAAERRVKRLVAEGKAVQTTKRIPYPSGGSRPVTAYKLVAEKKGKKKR